jgi:hypothetical protein
MSIMQALGESQARYETIKKAGQFARFAGYLAAGRNLADGMLLAETNGDLPAAEIFKSAVSAGTPGDANFASALAQLPQTVAFLESLKFVGIFDQMFRACAGSRQERKLRL